MTSPSLDFSDIDWNKPSDRVRVRFFRFASFVNDAQRLRLAVGAFRLRLLKEGLKKTEDEGAETGVALDWLVPHGGTSIDLHVVVDYWAALEVFVEDVFTDACASLDLTGIERLAKVRVPLVEFEAMLPEHRFRFLWEKTESPRAGFAVDRWDDLLGLVGISVDMGAVPPPERWSKGDNKSVRATLRELQQVRNVILHRGGVVDAKLGKIARHGQFASGQQLVLDPELVEEYAATVLEYATACMVNAVVALSDGAEPAGTGHPEAPGPDGPGATG